MAVGKCNQEDLVDMDKMISYMNREINLYWSALESNDGNKLRSIHKVPQHLLEVDRNAYEPIILSIGPYHHGAHNLTAMEREKWKSLDFMLKLNCESSLQDYIRALYKLEKRARSYYSQELSMDKMKFVQMLLLDSCFILVKVDGTVAAPLPLGEVNADGVNNKTEEECLNSGQAVESNSVQSHATDKLVHEIELADLHDHKAEPGSSTAKSEQNTDYPCSGDWYANFVWHDLFLLENQIPFFIVETVYNLALSKRRVKALLRDNIVECVADIMRQFPKGTEESNRPKAFHHLLHLCHMHLRPTHKFVGTNQHQLKLSFFRRLVHLGQRYFNLGPNQEDHEQHQLLTHSIDCFQNEQLPNYWRQAVQYHETGVQLKKREYSIYDRHSLLDIKFSNGVLEVPSFLIDENTESLFKNVIALEQIDLQFGNDITAYIAFMSQFVSTSEDVALLARRGIIVHMLDSDDEVSAMFTRLGTNIFFDFGTDRYHYLKTLCYTLEEYYQSRLNRWMAWLWRNHFSNPWLALGYYRPLYRTVTVRKKKIERRHDRRNRRRRTQLGLRRRKTRTAPPLPEEEAHGAAAGDLLFVSHRFSVGPSHGRCRRRTRTAAAVGGSARRRRRLRRFFVHQQCGGVCDERPPPSLVATKADPFRVSVERFRRHHQRAAVPRTRHLRRSGFVLVEHNLCGCLHI